mmetsp:Transcript_53995/g.128318  ORF Transcript_53995/g.128318 Transcript_53995/m.128318 type:complete len:287 (+) Transcript_53995:2122-2982(+)
MEQGRESVLVLGVDLCASLDEVARQDPRRRDMEKRLLALILQVHVIEAESVPLSAFRQSLEVQQLFHHLGLSALRSDHHRQGSVRGVAVGIESIFQDVGGFPLDQLVGQHSPHGRQHPEVAVVRRDMQCVAAAALEVAAGHDRDDVLVNRAKPPRDFCVAVQALRDAHGRGHLEGRADLRVRLHGVDDEVTHCLLLREVQRAEAPMREFGHQSVGGCHDPPHHRGGWLRALVLHVAACLEFLLHTDLEGLARPEALEDEEERREVEVRGFDADEEVVFHRGRHQEL